jgi:phage FluMu protein Com
MTTQHHPALAPLATRWATFLDKVKARVQEIDGEASAAYAEVIASDAVDGTALSGVSSALKARLLALAQKVDDAWEKIDGELDNIDLDDARISGRFRGTQLVLKAQFAHWLERETERIIVKGEADAARALHAVAILETQTTVPCAHCGAQLGQPLWHQAINVTCPHCKAVSVMTPGTASMMFTGGSGAHALAREYAWTAWCAMQDAEFQWHRLRHKTLEDLARWEAANRAYWQAYADAMGTLHPGWTPEHVANEVRGKMSWFVETTAKDDRTVREANGAGLAAVASGDPNQLIAWLKHQRDPDDAAETMIVAALERGWGQHATWIAQLAAPLVAADEPGWAAEKVDELTYYYATRGD